MLDNETKRRIDTARDILVGKVPDPKSQVEQITIALIYKFMDDMDSEAEELGGESSFFSGEYDKYGWRKIFNPGMGGFEMLSLYSEAILKMAQNPNLPQLFRDIFKNAYLPYRDPETLKSFLKIIDDFSYDQSEKLGDAFEYLLSILGSQGDAGQFRTPRHIIDFMTAIIDPRKTDSILDPACGTAGFLISAFKHILRQHGELKNDDFGDNFVDGIVRTLHATSQQKSRLTPDDRTRLTNNIRGYDISPDMVRLSLVNLYLHGFTDPHIFEYDTLTSEDRWNEYVDVILANPPFMSPKGGIRPHKRFSIQSNRSEVLFVDYMVEHLTPTGRAAIIVPEGVIFQSGTAYKSLRKMLVDENYLVGIISLPAGLFNPYSGVKTSILWIDKSLARKTDQIIFAKINADGFDLGAQRRPVKQNDLPDAFRAIQQYINFLQTGSMPVGPIHDDDFVRSLHDDDDGFVRSLHATTPPETSINDGTSQTDAATGGTMQTGTSPIIVATIGTLHDGTSQSDTNTVWSLHATTPQIAPSSESALQSIYPYISLVSKSDIAENGDYNLSGDRYKIQNVIDSDYPLIDFEDAIDSVKYSIKVKSSLFLERGKFPIIDQSDKFISGYSNNIDEVFQITKPVTIFGDHTRCFKYVDFDFVLGADGVKILQPNSKFDSKFFYYLIREISIPNLGYSRHYKELKDKKIPLPPISVQQEIVAEIESYQKIIDGARLVVENYKPRITIDPDWEMVELGEVCKIKGGYAFKSSDYTAKGIQLIRMGNVKSMFFDYLNSPSFLPEKFENQYSNFLLKKDDILISMTGTIGKEDYGNVCRIDIEGHFLLNQRVGKFEINENKLEPSFIYYLANSDQFRKSLFANSSGGVRQANISNRGIESVLIPLPPLETQHQIVDQIEREQALVNANNELIRLFEQKVKDRIARVWGEDVPIL